MMDTKKHQYADKPQANEKHKPGEAASPGTGAVVARSRRGACVVPQKERKD